VFGGATWASLRVTWALIEGLGTIKKQNVKKTIVDKKRHDFLVITHLPFEKFLSYKEMLG
jgi:hypothetical protein